MVGDVHLDLLQFSLPAFRGNRRLLAFLGNPLLLPAVQIHGGQLVDGLVQEGRGAHSRLADLQAQNIGGLVDTWLNLLERILHQALRKTVRRIEGGRRFTFPACKPVNERARLVGAQFAGMRAFVRVANAFVLRIVVEFAFRHKVADFQRVVGILGAFDLIELLLGDETTVGQQCLIHSTHLADAKSRVRDTLPALNPLTGLGDAHQVYDAQHYAVAECGMFNQRGPFRIENVRLERRNHEHRIDGFLASQPLEILIRLRVTVEHQIVESAQCVR